MHKRAGDRDLWNQLLKPQVPPLRYAPVGMTMLRVVSKDGSCSVTKLSSRPERSVVEGPAVSASVVADALDHF